MKLRLLLPAALAALLAVVAAAVPASAQEIRPAALPRGENADVPRLERGVITDGDVRVAAPEGAYLLGKSGDEYVVATDQQVLRVAGDGSTERITRTAADAEPTLSSDGQHLVLVRTSDAGRSSVRVVDADTGDLVASRAFGEYANVLDAAEGRMVLTASAPVRTFWWNFLSDASARIVAQRGGTTDIAADRLTTYTDDPYDGGCAVVRSLRTPTRVLWRSCQETVAAFAPNGVRMATMHILTDGLGPGEVRVRRTYGGAAIASYTASWFGAIVWETNRALILEANTRHRSAAVRCVVAECERASVLRRP